MIACGRLFVFYVCIAAKNQISKNSGNKMNQNDKEKIIEFLNLKYSHIDLNKIAEKRNGNTNVLSIELAKYAVEADKLNIFLVATNARKRAPVYLPVSDNIKHSLGVTSIKTNVDLKKITGFCREIITKKPYTFNLNEGEKLLFKLEDGNQRYEKSTLKTLEAKNYIKTILGGDKTAFYITKEGRARIDKILGRLFGYPKCCIDAFKKQNQRLSQTTEKTNKFNLENVPEYIKYGLNEDFLPYIKCSPNCKKSLYLSKRVYEYLKLVSNQYNKPRKNTNY